MQFCSFWNIFRERKKMNAKFRWHYISIWSIGIFTFYHLSVANAIKAARAFRTVTNIVSIGGGGGGDVRINCRTGFPMLQTALSLTSSALAALNEHLMHRTFVASNIQSRIVRKPCFDVSEQVQHKSGCTATENG